MSCPYSDESHSLPKQEIVLRDSLGHLAVQILCAREDIQSMEYSTMLSKLFEIINDLHQEYHRRNY